jgi:hypothetical protein
MSDLVFNVAKGAAAAWFKNVDDNLPVAGSEIVVMLLAASGIESDATLRDKVTASDLVSGATNEATNTGYAKKVLTDADITFTVDQANDRVDLDIPDQTWTGLANDGTGAVSDLVIGYDPVGSQTMSDILPMTLHDFSITPDGSDVTAQVAAAGFYRAS